MIDLRRCDPYNAIVQHDPWGREIVWSQKRRQRDASLIGDARVDVGSIHGEVLRGHVRQRCRTPAIDRRLKASRPCQKQQIAEIRVVIRVMVRDEHVTDRSERYVSGDQLPGHAVAAVHDIRRVVDEEHLRRREARLARAGAASGAEKDQSRAMCGCRSGRQLRGCRRCDQSHELPAIHCDGVYAQSRRAQSLKSRRSHVPLRARTEVRGLLRIEHPP